MTIKPTFTLIAILIALTACATSTPKDKPAAARPAALRGSDCVFFNTLYDWQSLDDHNMVIWAPGRRDAYHVYFMMPLIGLSFSTQLAFIDKDHDGRLCGFSRDEIAIADSSFPQRATISAMQRLDAEGIAKLEAQFKTKLSHGSKKEKPKEPDRETAK